MKERLLNILRSFTSTMSSAALSALLIALMLSLYDAPRTVNLALGVWALCLLVQSIVNECLAARAPSMLVYMLINAAMILATRHMVISRTVFIPGSYGYPILLGLLIIACGVHGAFAAQKLPESDFLVRMTDVLILSAGLYLAAAFSLNKAFHMPILTFVLAVFALLLITTSALRAGGESDSVIRGTGIGGWLVLGALLALCLLFTAVLLGIGSGHINTLVDLISAVWHALSAALAHLTKGFIYLLAFLIRPGKMRTQVSSGESISSPDIEIAVGNPIPAWVGYILLAVLALLAAAVVAAILWALHGTKFSRRRRAIRRRRITRKSHFLSSLLALIRRIAGFLSFEIACIAGRHTPQGLLVLAQRTGRLHRLTQKTSESGGAYLRRLHNVLTAHQAESSLDSLASKLDAVLYGGETIRLTREEYAVYAAQIRRIRALHAQTHTPSSAARKKP